MEKYNYNLSDQLDHIAYMFNVRTKEKAYENFIVNAIYAKVGNPELMPVTQQYVKNPNDSRGYYLLDLYFPQINLGIEVDERQHYSEENQLKDNEREKAIKNAIECEVCRVAIFEKDESGLRKRKYNDICDDIDKIVAKIKDKIAGLSGELDWVTNEEKLSEILKQGVFDAEVDVNYRTITDIYNICGGSRKNGEKVRGLRGAYYRLNDKYHLWVPTLAVEKPNGGYISNHRYLNILNEDKTIITERSLKKQFSETNDCTTPKKCTNPKSLRVIFIRSNDIFGRPSIKFLGVFKLKHYINASTREFERIYTKVKIEDLRQGK